MIIKMWLQLIFIAIPLILSAEGIKVPIDNENENHGPIKKADTVEISPTYYVSEDANIDSYLIPPDPHRIEELPPDVITPATYLLPPAPGVQTDFFNPTEPSEQNDWYPISQKAPLNNPEPIPILYQNAPEYPVDQNPRRPKQFIVPTPSLHLEPPLEDAPNEYFAPTSSENLQKPSSTIEVLSNEDTEKQPIYYQPKVEHLPLHLIPPHQNIYNKYPKKVYPKKYRGEFKPVPIPIAQYFDEATSEIPRAKPVKLLKPQPSIEIDLLTPTNDKINYLYRKAENKRKLKAEELKESPTDVSGEKVYNRPTSTEQVTSESFRHPGRNVYPAPLKQSPPRPSKPDVKDANAPAPDGRTEFRMHGMKGPHSYQFGYDTGKGKNRQFRYEERENDGQVKGHYGYVDRHGKLRVVNYSAHPETGFHAEAEKEVEKEEAEP